MTEIERRLTALEQLFSTHRTPTYEEFAAFWQTLPPFDRACVEGDALREENTVLRGYLEKMGVLNGNEKTLQQIAKELDAGGANDDD